MAASVTDDEAIREKAMALIVPGKEKQTYFAIVGVHEVSSPSGIRQLLGKNGIRVMVHASCRVEAMLVVADNIVKNTVTSDYPTITYKDIYGTDPTSLGGWGTIGLWCDFYKMDDQVKQLEVHRRCNVDYTDPIREAVVRLIERMPDKKENRKFVVIDSLSNNEFSSIRIVELFNTFEDHMIVHASCKLDAYLNIADNILAISPSETYMNIFGEVPTEERVTYLRHNWCEIYEIECNTEQWELRGCGRTIKASRSCEI